MTMFNQVQRDEEWVLKMASAEEGSSIDAGGLRSRMAAIKGDVSQRSLAHFLELSRRQLGLSPAKLAEKAEVSLADLQAIENGAGAVTSPETLVRLATFLGVDPQPLLCLATLRVSDNEQLNEVAVQFTDRLEPVTPLEPRESEALKWFKTEAFKVVGRAAKTG